MSDLKGLEQEGIFVDTLFRNPTYSGSEMYAIKSISGPVSADAQWYVQACSAYNTPTNLPFNTNMGGITARCFFNPYPQFTDTNDLSLVVFIEFAGFKILFPAIWKRQDGRHCFNAPISGQLYMGLISSSHPITDEKAASAKTCSTGLCRMLWSFPTSPYAMKRNLWLLTIDGLRATKV